MRSVMQHSFSEVPRANIPRSSFNRSHGCKTTLDADYLVPVLLDDVVPGDSVNCKMQFFGRLASPTVVAPLDNLVLESFFFFIPYRLLWENFKKFHGEQVDPGDSIDYTIPVASSGFANTADISSNDWATLANYFGMPAVAQLDFARVSALPFRAYAKVWNDWFRDENLQDSLDVPTDDGHDGTEFTAGVYDMQKRGKRKDYFTSCLPWPQKGDAVALPLGTTAPITGLAISSSYGWSTGGVGSIDETDNAATSFPGGYLNNPGTSLYIEGAANAADTIPAVYADLSNAAGATINELRLAFQTQRLLERDARGGTRYNEMILAHFGVTVPDYRLQRPEFLGGGSSPINLSPVAQTTYEGTQTVENAKGALSAIGTVSGAHGFTKSFVEHGLILGLVNIRGDITYSQGLERYWTKSTRYDFYYPVLSQIGEQSVLNREIYVTTGVNLNAGVNDDVFGYQERYAEYRYKPSRLTGLMNVDVTTPANLDEFHFSEDFASLPTLNATFIEANTAGPLDRAISVPTQPHMILDMYFNYRWARPMPLYGVPGNLDHF